MAINYILFSSIWNWYSDILYCAICELYPLLIWESTVKSINRLVSYYYKVHCEYLWSAEGKGGAPTTPITCLFDIRSYCLFCGNSDKNSGKKDGYELICVQTLDFQVYVLKACDKWNVEWSSCIHARFGNVKDLYAIDVITILATECLKPTCKFRNNHAWGWYEKWKDSDHASILIHRK